MYISLWGTLSRQNQLSTTCRVSICEPSKERNSSFPIPAFSSFHLSFSYLKFYTVHRMETASIIRGCVKLQVLFQEVCKGKKKEKWISFSDSWWMLGCLRPYRVFVTMQPQPAEPGGAWEGHDVILISKACALLCGTQVSAQAFFSVVGHHLELRIKGSHA